MAIKVLSRRRSRDRCSVDRFRHETRAIGQLEHPNIVRATDAGHVDGRHYLVMEYANGASVSEILQFHGPLSVGDACEIVRQAALGLAYAHRQEMVHRDVKPSNLLLTISGVVKLLDLGLVAFRVNEHDTAQVEGPRGTSDYMAPEQWKNYATVDNRADLYSLGCTLFKLLTGVGPFSQLPEEYRSKQAAHLLAPPPPLGHWRDDVPGQLVGYVSRLLAKSPADRPESATEVAATLEKFTGNADLRALVAVAMENLKSGVLDGSTTTRTCQNRVPIYKRRQFLQLGSVALAAGCVVHWWTSARHRTARSANRGLNCEILAAAIADGAQVFTHFVGHFHKFHRNKANDCCREASVTGTFVVVLGEFRRSTDITSLRKANPRAVYDRNEASSVTRAGHRGVFLWLSRIAGGYHILFYGAASRP